MTPGHCHQGEGQGDTVECLDLWSAMQLHGGCLVIGDR